MIYRLKAEVGVVRMSLAAFVALMLAATKFVLADQAPATAADPAVTQETLAATICVPGYTQSIRHRTKHAARRKLELLAQAGLSPDAAADFRLDHLLPLALGGNPSDPSNLIIQPVALSYRKDRVERKLHCLVCNGQITLIDAQSAILADWDAAYHKYALIKCRRPRQPTPTPQPPSTPH